MSSQSKALLQKSSRVEITNIFEFLRNKKDVIETLLPLQSSAFYEALKNCKEPDLRDKRGRVHGIGLVLMGALSACVATAMEFCPALTAPLKITHAPLCHYLGFENTNSISRAQLPIILTKIDSCSFSKLLFEFVGITLNDEEKQWFAADGK